MTSTRQAPSTLAYEYVRHTRLALRADWDRLLFIHYAVDPVVLRPFVPYPFVRATSMAGRASFLIEDPAVLIQVAGVYLCAASGCWS